MLVPAVTHAALLVAGTTDARRQQYPLYTLHTARCAFCGAGVSLANYGWKSDSKTQRESLHAARKLSSSRSGTLPHKRWRMALGRQATGSSTRQCNIKGLSAGRNTHRSGWPYSTRRSVGHRAAWEDIQWSNVSSRDEGEAGSSLPRRSKRTKSAPKLSIADDDDEADEDEGNFGLRRGRTRRRSPYEFLSLDDDMDEDDGLNEEEFYTSRDGAGAELEGRWARWENGGDGVTESEPKASWNAGWFQDAQREEQGGLFAWVKNFYNALFWYGSAAEDDYSLPAMNFKDLLERFDDVSGSQQARRPTAIVRPEELASEQDYRWQPARGEGRDHRDRLRSRSRRAVRDEDRQYSRSRRDRRTISYPPPYDRDSKPQLRKEPADDVVVERLRRKERRLAERKHGFRANLEKVKERLGVVDATVELWLRRAASMKARGASESSTEILQAKRRIYGLKEEGRKLDDARTELEERLEDCRAKLDRIAQELERYGEMAEPPLSGEPSSFPAAETRASSTSTSPPSAIGETRVEVEKSHEGFQEKAADIIEATGVDNRREIPPFVADDLKDPEKEAVHVVGDT